VQKRESKREGDPSGRGQGVERNSG